MSTSSSCTPNHLHHDAVLAASTAGKHVVCEKPLATTLSDTQELAEAAAQNGSGHRGAVRASSVCASARGARADRPHLAVADGTVVICTIFKALARPDGWRSDPARA